MVIKGLEQDLHTNPFLIKLGVLQQILNEVRKSTAKVASMEKQLQELKETEAERPKKKKILQKSGYV